MQYEKVILGMLDRIAALEERVSALEGSGNESRSRTKLSKFENLSAFFAEMKRDSITLSFSEIERILGFPLSPSAREVKQYWSNSDSHSIAQCWLRYGYKTYAVDLAKETVSFRKLRNAVSL